MCTPVLLYLLDRKTWTRLRLSWFKWTALLKAGQSGTAVATIPKGRLLSGDIKWFVLQVERSGEWMDERLSESVAKVPSLLEK